MNTPYEELSEEEKESDRKEADKYIQKLINEYDIRPLRNILAVIHGDGGHHTEKVGLKQSIKDAEEKLYDE